MLGSVVAGGLQQGIAYLTGRGQHAALCSAGPLGVGAAHRARRGRGLGVVAAQSKRLLFACCHSRSF